MLKSNSLYFNKLYNIFQLVYISIPVVSWAQVWTNKHTSANCRFSIADCRMKPAPIINLKPCIRNRGQSQSWRAGLGSRDGCSPKGDISKRIPQGIAAGGSLRVYTTRALAEYLVQTNSRPSQTLKDPLACAERYRYRLEGNSLSCRSFAGLGCGSLFWGQMVDTEFLQFLFHGNTLFIPSHEVIVVSLGLVHVFFFQSLLSQRPSLGGMKKP